ncbi:glutathione S-transferase [Thamnocephalis sphaerospora]|uniref:Glutathione S-transferase n=1 Tax=Thamnocephalis sphaerospora TaxID=78915 RepID=A0A4P9XKG1_9FUNG|nr:glutathione S-transferase [Thamnocephalis sphaerospora]|eukprot:RKP06242.1 glutathione S-transferase [Thamnocephalis sphaerospora]
MTFGTVYTFPQNPRAAKAAIAAKYAGVELSIPQFDIGTENKTPEYIAKFPTGQVPAFENDKTNLFESNAIAFYVASQGDAKLLGATKECTAEVLQWLFFISNRIDGPLAQWLYPILGFVPYNKGAYHKAVNDIKGAFTVLNAALLHKTYLVGESITLADIVLGATLSVGFTTVLAPEHVGSYKNLMRYVKTLYAQPQFKDVLGEIVFATSEKKYAPPS